MSKSRECSINNIYDKKLSINRPKKEISFVVSSRNLNSISLLHDCVVREKLDRRIPSGRLHEQSQFIFILRKWVCESGDGWCLI